MTWEAEKMGEENRGKMQKLWLLEGDMEAGETDDAAFSPHQTNVGGSFCHELENHEMRNAGNIFA